MKRIDPNQLGDQPAKAFESSGQAFAYPLQGATTGQGQHHGEVEKPAVNLLPHDNLQG
jgi:hypothetical protein